MAWEPGVPAEDNAVRANDLPKIRANWDMLTPMVVSGLDGLPGVEVATVSGNQVLGWTGTEWGNIDNVLSGQADVNVVGAVSGDALVYNGVKWVPGAGSSVSGLDDLQDVNTAGAVSGDALVYDGSGWVPSAVAGVSGDVARVACLLDSGNQIIPNNTWTQVSGTLVPYNVGGWGVSNGAITVPSGVTHVDVLAQICWENTAFAVTKLHSNIYLNGSRLSDIPGYGGIDTAAAAWKGSSWATVAQQVTALDVPVSPGDVLTLHVLHSRGATLNTYGSGEDWPTFLQVREVAAGGGGGGFTANGTVYMPDAPPLSPPSYNDEFTGDMSKWTTWDVGSNGLVAAVAAGLNLNDHMRMYLPSSAAADEWAGVYQSLLPLAGDSYSLIAKIGLTANEDSGQEVWYGLVAFVETLAAPATAGWYGMLMRYDGAGVVPGHAGFYAITDYQDETPILVGTPQDAAWSVPPTTGLYFRLTWEDNGGSDRDLSGWLSLDGQNWLNFGHVFGSLGWQPFAVGLVMMQPTGAAGAEPIVKTQFIRLQPADIARDLTLSGAMVDLQYSS
jgi:hypothetical protein